MPLIDPTPMHPGYYRIVKDGELMAKTYVPQLARMARKLERYIVAHQATINTYVTDPTKQAAITSCSTCLASLASLASPEKP